MVLEVAILDLRPGTCSSFEKDFDKAIKYLSATQGYIKHDLKKCIEKNSRYILLVEWNSIEDHNIGFRRSENYQKWKLLLHHYYDPFPLVEHYC